MNLAALGWDDRLAGAFRPFEVEGLMAARVIRQMGPIAFVHTAAGELEAEVSGRLKHEAASKADLPVVGDWVAVRPGEGDGPAAIRAVLPRKSAFTRKVAGTTTDEQVVAANVDTVFLVTGLDADYSVRRIERYLTMAWESGAAPVVVLNKADLCDDVSARVREVAAVAFDAPVHGVSALSGDGIEAFSVHLRVGATAAFLGSSGAGKSTLINRLLGEERLAVGAVRARDGQGQHTTSHRELIVLPGGGLVIDTPGMREIGLWTDGDALRRTFEDIEALAAGCRFRDCAHQAEPGCAVRQAVADGELDADRLDSYHRLQKEAAYLERRRDQSAARVERDKWKKIATAARNWSKEKRSGLR